MTRILCIVAAMDVRPWSTHDEVLLLCQGTMLICTRAEKQGGQRVSWTLAGHAYRQQRLLLHLDPATLVGMRWQDCVTWDPMTSRRLRMPSAIYTNNVAPPSRRAPTPSTTTPRLHQQHHYTGRRRDNHGRHWQWLQQLRQGCHRIKEASSNTSITLSQRKDESGRHCGRLRNYTNDTHHCSSEAHGAHYVVIVAFKVYRKIKT
jgi:hypothetical protein